MGYNPFLSAVISAFSEINSKSKQFVLSANNFTRSEDFYSIIEIIPAHPYEINSNTNTPKNQ